MAEIRARIEERRREAGYEERAFPRLEQRRLTQACRRGLVGCGPYHHLWLANQLYNQAETAPVLAASAATQLPLFGRLWKLVREQAHQLVLFYVNRLVAHQTNVDRHLVSVANELTREIQEQQEQIRALQEEVEALRQKGNRS